MNDTLVPEDLTPFQFLALFHPYQLRTSHYQASGIVWEHYHLIVLK